MPDTAMPELASVLMMLSVFASMFLVSNVVARVRGYRE